MEFQLFLGATQPIAVHNLGVLFAERSAGIQLEPPDESFPLKLSLFSPKKLLKICIIIVTGDS